MGIADKVKSSKDNRFKVKRIRFGNVKDFHGHRQHGENKLIREETRSAPESLNISANCFPQKPILPFSRFTSIPLQFPKTEPVKSPTDKSMDTSESSLPPHQNRYNFDTYMSQWAQDLRKPLTRPSTNLEFDMPYCYSEEFYNKVSAKCFMMQPFNSIGEPPMELWNPHADGWYEKAQLALQYYRHLCEQPSRLPLQTITIKRSIAQFAAEQCALLGTEVYFETLHDSGIRIGNIVFEEKNKPTLYLVPDHCNTIKQPECSGMELKSDSSIFTSSWQN